MQIEHPNFLIKIYFVNIKQTTQLQLVPEDKVAILWMRFPTFEAGLGRYRHGRLPVAQGRKESYCGGAGLNLKAAEILIWRRRELIIHLAFSIVMQRGLNEKTKGAFFFRRQQRS